MLNIIVKIIVMNFKQIMKRMKKNILLRDYIRLLKTLKKTLRQTDRKRFKTNRKRIY